MTLKTILSTTTSFLGGIKVYLIVGASCLLIGYGGGFYHATKVALNVNANVAPKAVAAQSKEDKRRDAVADQKSDEVERRRADEDTAFEAKMRRLEEALQRRGAVSEVQCPMYDETVIQTLNEAGQ